MGAPRLDNISARWAEHVANKKEFQSDCEFDRVVFPCESSEMATMYEVRIAYIDGNRSDSASYNSYLFANERDARCYSEVQMLRLMQEVDYISEHWKDAKACHCKHCSADADDGTQGGSDDQWEDSCDEIEDPPRYALGCCYDPCDKFQDYVHAILADVTAFWNENLEDIEGYHGDSSITITVKPYHPKIEETYIPSDDDKEITGADMLSGLMRKYYNTAINTA